MTGISKSIRNDSNGMRRYDWCKKAEQQQQQQQQMRVKEEVMGIVIQMFLPFLFFFCFLFFEQNRVVGHRCVFAGEKTRKNNKQRKQKEKTHGKKATIQICEKKKD